MISRRSLLAGVLTSCVAPVFVPRQSLMRVAPPKLNLLRVDPAGRLTPLGLYNPELARHSLKYLLYGELYGRPIEVPGLDVVSIKRIPSVDATGLESHARFIGFYKGLYVRSQ